MQHQGYENAPIKQIVRDAEATLGSLYHFFPGGKQELAVAAIRFGDQEFAELLRSGLDSARTRRRRSGQWPRNWPRPCTPPSGPTAAQ